MISLVHDVRQAVRNIRNHPGFASLAVLALALGIGAATTIFSVLQHVLFKPFPYTDAERIVVVQVRRSDADRRSWRSAFPIAEFREYATQSAVFAEVAADAVDEVLFDTSEGIEHLRGALVSGNLFAFLGVHPVLGRGIAPDDAAPGAPAVFVISNRMWRARFGSDPSVVGQTYALNGMPTVLVGIMPPQFAHLDADLWRPVSLDQPSRDAGSRFYNLKARLAPGVSTTAAEAHLQSIATRIAPVFPRIYPEGYRVHVVRWIDSVVGPFRATLYILAAAVAVLLLIACANVANMLLARASTREGELAIRASLGASRSALVRQLLIESSLLAAAGALIGVLAAVLGVTFLVRILPDQLIPPEATIRINLPVLVFGIVLAFSTVLIFGLVPALRTAHRDLVSSVPSAARSTSTKSQTTLSSMLVVAQVALALVLAVGAGLLIRTFVNVRNVQLGFDPANTLALTVRLPSNGSPLSGSLLVGQILDRLRTVPAVTAATVTNGIPGYGGLRTEVEVPGQPTVEPGTMSLVQFSSEDLASVLRLPILRGRFLSRDDITAGRRVAVVNEALAQRYFGHTDIVGRSVRLNILALLAGNAADTTSFEVVGITADAKNHGIQEPAIPESFVPYSLASLPNYVLLIRTSGSQLAPFDITRQLRTVDRGIVVTENRRLIEYLQKFSYSEPRFGVAVLGMFASTALILVALGVYGVVGYTTSRRTREFGIRLALGATPATIQRHVIGRSLRLVGFGLVFGLIAAFAVTQLIRSQLWGVPPRDPMTLAIAVSVVLIVGIVACWAPARRATSIDPTVTMRSE